MVYKKFIKRNGKLYGPYVYQSRRVNGKVVSEYRGVAKKDFRIENIHPRLLVVFAFVALAIIAGLIIKPNFSGKAILDMQTDYVQGESLSGFLKIHLKEGELIPASSKILLEDSKNKYEYSLNELISDNIVEGNFYVEGKTFSGSGLGYGKEGTIRTYPSVSFTMKILQTDNNQRVVSESPQEIIDNKSDNANIENNEAITNRQETSQETELIIIDAEAENNGENSDGGEITGGVIIAPGESENEINGEVSADKPFVYELGEGQRAEIVSSSHDVQLNTEGSIAKITTDYSEIQNGFGKEYIGEGEKIILVELSKLNFVPTGEKLKASLVYDSEEISSLELSLQNQNKEQEINKNIPQNNESKNTTLINQAGEINATQNIISTTINSINLNLTDSEKKILADEFDNATIKTTKSELFNGRIIIGYKIGDYEVEYSYDVNLSEEDLKGQMEIDRIKWLKNIAKRLSQQEIIPQKIEGFNESYAV